MASSWTIFVYVCSLWIRSKSWTVEQNPMKARDVERLLCSGVLLMQLLSNGLLSPNNCHLIVIVVETEEETSTHPHVILWIIMVYHDNSSRQRPRFSFFIFPCTNFRTSATKVTLSRQVTGSEGMEISSLHQWHAFLGPKYVVFWYQAWCQNGHRNSTSQLLCCLSRATCPARPLGSPGSRLTWPVLPSDSLPKAELLTSYQQNDTKRYKNPEKDPDSNWRSFKIHRNENWWFPLSIPNPKPPLQALNVILRPKFLDEKLNHWFAFFPVCFPGGKKHEKTYVTFLDTWEV